MPQGGRCTIETLNVGLDEEYVCHKNAVIPVGRYAVMTVTDTGLRNLAGSFAAHF